MFTKLCMALLLLLLLMPTPCEDFCFAVSSGEAAIEGSGCESGCASSPRGDSGPVARIAQGRGGPALLLLLLHLFIVTYPETHRGGATCFMNLYENYIAMKHGVTKAGSDYIA